MQRGTITLRGKVWTLFFYDLTATGERVRTSIKLAVKGKEYPSKHSVRGLADEKLAPLNRKQLVPESSLPLSQFIEDYYFPRMENELKPSTLMNYKKSIYYPHLKGRLDKNLRIRDFKTVHAQRLLREIKGVGHTTLLHIKNFLSGVFRFGIRNGVIENNPMDDSTVPGRPKKFKGAAYTLAETARMVEDLDAVMYLPPDNPDDYTPPKLVRNAEPYQTAKDVIMMLSLTGLRQGEIRGLRWSDWDEEKQTLMIQRAVWQTKVGMTKNPASENTIPVLPLLRNLLANRRERIKPNMDDYIFAGERRNHPLDFHNLANRILKPVLDKASEKVLPTGEIILDPASGVEWKGFHGFRRGLASNLFGLGVNPKVIAAILRHGDISTTLQFYVQTPDSESRAALQKLEESIKALNSLPNSSINGIMSL